MSALVKENICEMGPDYDYIGAGSGVIVEWTSEIDPTHQVGLITFLNDVLMVVRGP